MHGFSQDIRYAARSIRRSPGFTATVVLVLALGIGANSTLFAIVNAVLLRPLPFPESGRILSLSMASGDGSDIGRLDEPTAQLLSRSRLRQFDAIAFSNGTGANLTGGGAPERVTGARISSGFFDVMQVAPALGRTFAQEELVSGGPPVVILGDGLWKRDFGADPRVVGRVVELDDVSYTVVGIMPPGYDYPDDAEYWLPLPSTAQIEGDGYFFVDAIGRLKSGVTLESAVAELEAIRRRHATQLPAGLRDTRLRAMTLHERAYGELRPVLLILLGTVGCVLLIACANVANLLLARATIRRREFSLRTALGAATSRLVQQLLLESAMLALLGGALGLLFPLYGLQLLSVIGPRDLQTVPGISVNADVLLFTLVVSLATGLIFGTAPALALVRGNVHDDLRSGGGTLHGGGGRTGPRQALVAAELSLAVVLLVGAGLLIRSFANFRGVDPGFRPGGVLTATINLPAVRYASSASREEFFRDLLSRSRAIPGVEAAALSGVTPLGGFQITRRLAPRDGAAAQAALPQFAMASVGTDYFAVFGVPLLAGREFTEGDVAGSVQVAIISRSMARAAFPGRGAVGERLEIGDDESYVIVGVAADARQLPSRATPMPMLYTSQLQSEAPRYSHISIRARSGTDPVSLVPALRAALHTVDATQPLSDITTMESLLSQSMTPRRFNMLLVGSFAVLACALAAVGLYGVIAYLVAERTREIGLRMALGAESRQLVLTVLRQGMQLVLIGVGVGVFGSLALSRLLDGMLFQVAADDPLVLIAVPLLLLAVAALAVVIPARRASRVDPLIALRAE